MSEKPKIVAIDFSHRTILSECEGAECLTYFKGIGKTLNENDEEVECGEITGCYVKIETLEYGDVINLLDDFEEELSHYIPFFDEGNQYNKELFKHISGYENKDEEDNYAHDFLILLKLTIKPEYQGLGFGKYMIKESIISYRHESDFVFIDAFPLQLEALPENREEEKKKKFSRYLKLSKKQAHEKLVNYYKKLGFKTVKGIDRVGNGGQLMARIPYDFDW